ncbi:MAG: hypothetical protein RJS97_08595 [Parvibaculaceae bacterium]
MLSMFFDSVLLFFKGKLFKDPMKVVIRGVIGVGVVIIICVGLTQIGLSFGLAAIIGGFIGSALQPLLFKDLQFA